MKPGLRHFFDSMRGYVTGGDALEDLYAAHPGWQAPRSRLGLYRDFYRLNVRSTLEKLYPLVRKRLGEPLWESLVEAYRATGPARSFSVNHLGEAFPGFLADETAARALPAWASALARFEWTDYAVCASLEEVPSRVERLTVNPTVQMLQHPFQLCACVRARAEAPPEPGQELALLWRHPETLGTMYLAAGERSLLVVKMALEGLSAADVVAATGMDESLLQEALEASARDGLVLLPQGPA